MPDSSADFRRKATWSYRVFVAFVGVVAIGLVVAGWWFGGWWGLFGGAAIGALVFVGGVIAGTLLWAMSQDGG